MGEFGVPAGRVEQKGASGGSVMGAVVTVVARNYLPYARVLMQSVGQYHPEVSRYVLVVDGDAGEQGLPGSTVLGPHDVLTDQECRLRAYIYDVVEYSTSLKPALLLYLLSLHERVTFLDPDMALFAPLPPQILESSATIQVTPHRIFPEVRDGKYPDASYVKQYGVFNAGFISVREGAQPFLHWWDEQVARDCCVDILATQFTDQRWLDVAAAYFDLEVVRHPGMNVAKWNLDERALSLSPRPRVGDVDLVLAHFSGVPNGSDGSPMPLVLRRSDARARRDPPRLAAFEQLCSQYTTALRAAGYPSPVPYRWGRYPDGQVVSMVARRHYRRTLMRAERDGRLPPPLPQRELRGLSRLDFLGRLGVVQAMNSGLRVDRSRMTLHGVHGTGRMLKGALRSQ